MTQPQQQVGFFWHVHHDTLFEWCRSYNERVRYIRNFKPAHEWETRIRLFQPVKGQLPKEMVEAWKARDQALDASNRAWVVRDRQPQLFNSVRRDYEQAQDFYDKAVKKNQEEIKKLHAQECPNCPWNGHSIFPDREVI